MRLSVPIAALAAMLCLPAQAATFTTTAFVRESLNEIEPGFRQRAEFIDLFVEIPDAPAPDRVVIDIDLSLTGRGIGYGTPETAPGAPFDWFTGVTLDLFGDPLPAGGLRLSDFADGSTGDNTGYTEGVDLAGSVTERIVYEGAALAALGPDVPTNFFYEIAIDSFSDTPTAGYTELIFDIDGSISVTLVTGGGVVAPVPLPAGGGLLAAAMLGGAVAGHRRRRRR